jgi:hypothetical protein
MHPSYIYANVNVKQVVRNLCLFYYRPLSLDEGLQKEPDTPGSASKMRKGSVFGSLEKVFNMLTPKKQ